MVDEGMSHSRASFPLGEVEHDGPGQRILVVVAHPDDAEFMIAGSVARWIREGREVAYLVCTDGDKGSSDPDLAPERLAQIRREEQRAACAVLGVREVVFLGYADGLLQNTLELRRDIACHIRRLRPDALVCQDPTRRWYGNVYLNHPDHRAAGDAALDAVFPLARDYHILPELIQEGLLPHKVRHIYLSPGFEEADVWFDITDTIEQKIAALYEHKTQINGAEQPREAAEFIRLIGRYLAEERDMEYAEAFKYIRLD
jgi:LmbE family N-acetylglucosaminyl deacetylase